MTTCVQDPREVMLVPTAWWHATCNFEPFTLGVGGQDSCDMRSGMWAECPPSDDMYYPPVPPPAPPPGAGGAKLVPGLDGTMFCWQGPRRAQDCSGELGVKLAKQHSRDLMYVQEAALAGRDDDVAAAGGVIATSFY